MEADDDSVVVVGGLGVFGFGDWIRAVFGGAGFGLFFVLVGV